MKNILLIISLIGIIVLGGHATPTEETTPKSYRGYSIYHVKFTTDEQFQILYKMMIESGEHTDYNVHHLSRANKVADIMVKPNKQTSFTQFMDQNGFTYKLTTPDLGDQIRYSRSAESEDRVSYKGYKVYEVKFSTEEQFNQLHELQTESTTDGGINFWHLSKAESVAHIMVSPAKSDDFLNFMNRSGFSTKVLIEDVQAHIDSNNV